MGITNLKGNGARGYGGMEAWGHGGMGACAWGHGGMGAWGQKVSFPPWGHGNVRPRNITPAEMYGI
jgi:hypothetical protein